MRLFIAISLNDVAYFQGLQEPLRASDGARMTFPAVFHVTLKFLGDVHDAVQTQITAALSMITWKSFELTCDHIGVFPEQGKPRVLWAGFSEDDGYRCVSAIQKDIDCALKPLGFAKEKGFVPHVTLARIKDIDPAFQGAFIKAFRGLPVPPLTCPVSSFHLVASTLGGLGPAYHTVASFPAI